ncbi:hypothetical protein VZT92_017810 [Zoarces viviparus]|uniref:IF rod domain-containing protein n=1 Tax=Zoarces viviparus TaxID=48416 RepID=A0AAW1ERN4_ZOAVI
MPSHTAASMFGGAGGRGCRASVASLEGLRNMLRSNETDRDSAAVAPATSAEPPAAAAAPVAPVAPADDKQTLRGLNDRLSGYLGRVRHLEKENDDMEKEIDGILAKRKTPEGRDWDEVEKPLENLKKQIKDITMDNAKLLLQIENTKLAAEDFNKKLDGEEKAEKEVEKDVEDLKKTIEDTKLNQTQTQKEIDLVKEELTRLEQEHKEVDVLREKIKDSEVKVEIRSHSSNLGEVVNKIRFQYDKQAQKNLMDTEEWYQSEFENIKVVEAQNNEDLHSGKSELKEVLQQRTFLEIKIQSFQSKIHNLEGALESSKVEYGQRLGPLNQVILHLEAELREVRAQVEGHLDNNKNLLCVKMKLEEEMDNYQRLMQSITPDPESLEVSLEDAAQRDQRKPDSKAPEQQEEVKEEAPVKQESSPSGKSTPPKAPEADQPPRAEEGDRVQNKVAVNNAPRKENQLKTSSSSSSSSENEDEKPEEADTVAKA